MLRFYYIIAITIPLILYYIFTANYYCSHEDKYDEEARFGLVLRIINSLKRVGRIKTVSMNEENLPKEGGYIMVSTF